MQLYKASRRRLRSRRFKTSAQTNTCNDKVLPRASSDIHTYVHTDFAKHRICQRRWG